jgi:NO-binding membrane sensor protein with MHYT domain
MHWCWIVDQEHWVFSNGCSGQFKGAWAMFFVAMYLGLTNNCNMRWQFFGTGHGNGNFEFIISIQVHVVIIEL